jgi:hypothetical protein
MKDENMTEQSTEEVVDWRYYVKRFFVLLIYCFWILRLNKNETPQILVVGIAFLPGFIVMKMKVKRWVVLLIGGLSVIGDGILIYYTWKLGFLAAKPAAEAANLGFLISFIIGLAIIPSIFPNFVRNSKVYFVVIVLLVSAFPTILAVLERGNYAPIFSHAFLAAVILYAVFSKKLEITSTSTGTWGQEPLWGSWKFEDEKEN